MGVRANQLEAGIVELATNTEAQTGTDAVRAVTPANVAAVFAVLTHCSMTATCDPRLAPSSRLAYWKPTSTLGRSALRIGCAPARLVELDYSRLSGKKL